MSTYKRNALKLIEEKAGLSVCPGVVEKFLNKALVTSFQETNGGISQESKTRELKPVKDILDQANSDKRLVALWEMGDSCKARKLPRTRSSTHGELMANGDNKIENEFLQRAGGVGE